MTLITDSTGLDWINEFIGPDHWTLTDLAVIQVTEGAMASYVRTAAPAGVMIVTQIQTDGYSING